LIRTFRFCESEGLDGAPAKIELQRIFIEGQFSIAFSAGETISPRWYTKGDPQSAYKLSTKFNLDQLRAVAVPLVAITGQFEHVRESDEENDQKKRYKVQIRNALLTEDFPGSFYIRPLVSSTYTFVATEALIGERGELLTQDDAVSAAMDCVERQRDRKRAQK